MLSERQIPAAWAAYSRLKRGVVPRRLCSVPRRTRPAPRGKPPSALQPTCMGRRTGRTDVDRVYVHIMTIKQCGTQRQRRGNPGGGRAAYVCTCLTSAASDRCPAGGGGSERRRRCEHGQRYEGDRRVDSLHFSSSTEEGESCGGKEIEMRVVCVHSICAKNEGTQTFSTAASLPPSRKKAYVCVYTWPWRRNSS